VITLPRLSADRIILGSAAVALLLATLHWLPGRQVRLHQKNLLRAVEDRKWVTVGGFISANYKDPWGQTKPKILKHLPQIFADFLALGVIPEEEILFRDDRNLVVQERIRIVGSGGPIAQFVMQESENLTAPFSFKWRKESWMPWDWALVEVTQPQADLPAKLEQDF